MAVAVLATWISGSGCRGDKQASTPDTEPPRATPDDAVTDGPEDAAASPKPGCAEGGRPWDGKLEGCLYEVEGCCYDTPAAACAAASCAEDRCQILESAPAQVACR